MKILLVKPDYYAPHPPLGLLKFATYYRDKGHKIEFQPRGFHNPGYEPDLILVTSLWTWAWWPVHRTIRVAKMTHKGAEIRLGGIYASLMPEHAAESGADEVVTGLVPQIEHLTPDYSLVPEWNGKPWDKSIVFASRGCNRNCDFCAVRTLEGGMQGRMDEHIENQIWPGHKWIFVQDNNILAAPNWQQAFKIFQDHNLLMDFTGGIDLRIVTDKQAAMIKEMRIRSIKAGFDDLNQWPKIRKGIRTFEDAGQRARDIILYELFNFRDTPQDLFDRIKVACDWKAVSYPMRFQPIKGVMALKKDSYISPEWTPDILEVVARGRRILGVHGAFPPTNALHDRLEQSTDLRQLFKINHRKGLGIQDPDQTKILDHVF